MIRISLHMAVRDIQYFRQLSVCEQGPERSRATVKM